MSGRVSPHEVIGALYRVVDDHRLEWLDELCIAAGYLRRCPCGATAHADERCDDCGLDDGPDVNNFFDVHRCDPEATFDIPPLHVGDAPLQIRIAAAGGGTVGHAYAHNDWIYDVCLAGVRVCSGADLRSGGLPHTHIETAAVLATHLADTDEVPALHRHRDRLGLWAHDHTPEGEPPMNPTVRVEAGYYLIDTDAWIRQRVGDRDTDSTALLREFTSHEAFRDQPHRMDMATRVMLWCTARGWAVAEGAPIEHDHPQLSRLVSIVLATLPQPDRRAVAIVIDDGGDPVVYPDRTTDEGYWYQVATVDIVCPTGHRMTWDGARGLVDHEGEDTTITAVFGTDRHAPFQPCRLCAAYADTDSGEGCDCGGWAIYCPVCGARTTLAVPGIPTHHRQRDHDPLST